jgi:Ca2+-binding RTX toxin-like protein
MHISGRRVRALASMLAVVAGCAIAAPAAASASQNVDKIGIGRIRITPFFTLRQIGFAADRFEGNPADPVRVTATEEAEGRTVTIRDVSTAAGGFVALTPCEKTEAQTAVCPTPEAEGITVSLISVDGAAEGNQSITIDTPTLLAAAQTGSGNDTISVPHARAGPQIDAAIIDGGAGDDTLTGSPGLDEIYGEQGTDTIFAFNEPAASDIVYCGTRAIERPVDIAHVDSLDTVNGECARVVRGP